jgi:hypothetical protein
MKKTLTLLSLLTLFLFEGVFGQTIPTYVPSNGLVAYYPFNGSANDESGNGNNGVVNGASLTNDRNGNGNSAYSFNGINGSISLAQPFLGGDQNSVFSFFARINFNSTASSPNIWGKTKFWGEINFQVNKDNSIQFWCANSISGNKYSAIISDPGVIKIGEWYDIVVVFNNSKGTIYLNGTPIKSNLYLVPQGSSWGAPNNELDASFNFAQDANSSNFGYRIDGSGSVGFLDGKIDDIAIWNRALTPTEVSTIYVNQATPPAPTGNTTQTFCSGSTVANLIATGTNIKWYAAVTGGTALVSTTNLVNGTTYYASQTLNGVESTNRLAVTVSIPKISFIASLNNVALGSNASFTGSIPGSATFQWQSNINDIGWINLPNNTTYSGVTSNKLNINNIKVSNHMQEFRLIANSGSCIDTSNVVTMSVNYTLPVELISFEAKLKNQDQVNLNWETSSELNNSYFTISKSSDGKSFNKLTTVASKGDGGIYSAVDQNPFSGTTYYQLSQTDKDGKTEELGIKAVNISLSKTQQVIVYPNPTQNEVKVSFEKDFYTTAKLIDLQGKILQKRNISIADTELTFDLKSLDAGNYLIQLEGKEMVVQKVMKH